MGIQLKLPVPSRLSTNDAPVGRAEVVKFGSVLSGSDDDTINVVINRFDITKFEI